MDQLPVTGGGTVADRPAPLATFLRPRLLHWPVAVTLIAIVGLYAGFAMQQYAQLNELNQRELSNAAAQLKSSLDNALETVSRIRPTTTSSQADSAAAGQDRDTKPSCAFEDFDKQQPYLEIVSADPCKLPVSAPLDVSMSKKETEPLTLIATTRSDHRVDFKFRADVALRELSFPESFGLIFIADQQGRILYQDAPSKRVWLHHLRWGEKRFRDSTASYEGHSNLSQAKDIFGEGASGWPRLSAMSGRTTLQLAGDEHALYFEPLTVEKDSSIHFVLGGAVSRRAMIRQALAVDSYFLALLVFLLLLAFLGLPFVKLLSLHAYERFDLRDVILLHVSTAALLALITFAIETVNGYVRWNEGAAQGLRQLADRLADDVVSEVDAIQSVVKSYDCDVFGVSPDDLDKWPPVTNGLTEVGSNPQCGAAHSEREAHVETLSWIDAGGRQVWKIAADGNRGKQLGLSNRLYFRSVHDDHLFTIDGNARFHVGPDRSLVNGKSYTFLSMRSVAGTKEAADHRPVVVLGRARLVSLRAVALPAGYGYAVIDRTGRALYHSDPRLALRENLFDEMSAGTRARSITYAGHARSLTSAYRERPHAFHLRPLELQLATAEKASAPATLAGLYVVTFRDTSLDMATVARTFLQALCGPGLLLVVIIALSIGVMTLVASRKETHWSLWLWPNALAHVYPTVSAALVVVLLASLIGLRGVTRDIVLVALPIAAIAVAVAIYGLTVRQPATDFRRSTDWRTFMFLLLLVCTIVVPAAAVFRTALGHEFGKRIATERRWMHAQCTDMPREIKADMIAEGEPLTMADRFARLAEAHCARDLGAEAVHPYAPTLARVSSTSDWLLRPYHWADGLLPVNTNYDVRVRYQKPGDSDVSSVAPGPFPWGTRLGLAGYLAMFAALAWWLRKKSVLLFFADQTSHNRQPTSESDAWASYPRAEQLVLGHLVLDRMVNPYQRPVVSELIRRGVLSLEPHLTPSKRMCLDIQGQEGAVRQLLRESEHVDTSHSWRFVRGVLVASVVGLVLFLFATQPALQSEFVGLAGAVSGALATLVKLWDAFASRVIDRKMARGSGLVTAD